MTRLLVLGGGLLALAGARAHAGGTSDVAFARAQAVPRNIAAYAEVVPIALARLRAAAAGDVSALAAVPGQRVTAGSVLARLRGPAIDALLAKRRGEATSATAAAGAARRLLAIKRRMRSEHLSTTADVDRAEAAVAAAEARAQEARAALEAATDSARLRAPATGTVTSVAVADGARVQAGDTVLTIQPENRLWLKAKVYGADQAAVRAGMRGTFAPADGSAKITVEVARIAPAVQPDGGRPVFLRRAVASAGPEASWVAGEAGTVTIAAGERKATLVPAPALILDRGRFWVLVHTARGDRPRAVTPGPRRGSDQVIERGLAAGERVVVKNAYLRFHRGFAAQYLPPD